MLEICIDSVDSAIKAEKAGADRLELCENLIQGGVTPSLGKIEQVLSNVSIPVRILIRPRAGDFCYSKEELQVIQYDIQLISETQCEGLVVGALNENNELIPSLLDDWKSASKSKKLVFHRAFDLAKKPLESAKLLIENGFDTILTSGQKNTALEGAETLSKLQKKSGHKIKILAGGGVRASNIRSIYNQTRITQFHSSAKILRDQKMSVSMSNSPVAEQIFTVDSDEIKSMKDHLNEF